MDIFVYYDNLYASLLEKKFEAEQPLFLIIVIE